MKKVLVASILGLAAVGTSFAQGHIGISNYANPPYNQIYFQQGNQAVTSAANLTFQIYYGLGTIVDFNLLTAGNTFTIDNTISASYDPSAGHGAGGYFLSSDQTLAGWSTGQTWTFAYKVITAGATGTSALWQENAAITSTANPLGVANQSQSFGLAVSVPEPGTFALAGLGAAALMIFRRRK